jgi:Predicted transcriptional regulator
VGDWAAKVEEIGWDQHALATWNQLVDAGVPKSWIERQIAAGRLIREGPRTYRPWGVRRSWKLRALAAVLSAQSDALVSYQSAAYLWGLDDRLAPGFIDVTVPRHCRPKSRTGVTFHESGAFSLARPAIRDRIPVTGMARTLFDCFPRLDTDLDRLRLFDSARRQKLVPWDDLWECLLLHARRGRPGVTTFRRILVQRAGEGAPPGSHFARLMATVLEDAGLPGPVFEHPVLGYLLDLAWPALRVAVECDGRIAHEHEGAYESDRIRLNRLKLGGWLVLQYTWQQLRDDPAGVVAEVRQALWS